MATRSRFASVKAQILKYDLLLIFFDFSDGLVTFDMVPENLKELDDDTFMKKSGTFTLWNSEFLNLIMEAFIHPHPDMDNKDLNTYYNIVEAADFLLSLENLNEINIEIAVLEKGIRKKKKVYYSSNNEDEYVEEYDKNGDYNWGDAIAPKPRRKKTAEELKYEEDKRKAEEEKALAEAKLEQAKKLSKQTLELVRARMRR